MPVSAGLLPGIVVWVLGEAVRHCASVVLVTVAMFAYEGFVVRSQSIIGFPDESGADLMYRAFGVLAVDVFLLKVLRRRLETRLGSRISVGLSLADSARVRYIVVLGEHAVASKADVDECVAEALHEWKSNGPDRAVLREFVNTHAKVSLTGNAISFDGTPEENTANERGLAQYIEEWRVRTLQSL